jgi:hypothetical protein
MNSQSQNIERRFSTDKTSGSALLHPLQLHQLRISTPRFQKALMIPTLNNLPLIYYIYYICILDGAKTVRDRDCGAAFGDAVECFLDDMFGGGVER